MEGNGSYCKIILCVTLSIKKKSLWNNYLKKLCQATKGLIRLSESDNQRSAY
jgi:hypothetical protein